MSSIGPPSAVRRKFGIAENFDSFGDESWHATLAFGGTTCLQGPGCVREVMSVRAGVKLRQVSGGGPTGLHKHLLARISRTAEEIRESLTQPAVIYAWLCPQQHPRLMSIHTAMNNDSSGMTLHRTVGNLKTESEGPIHVSIIEKSELLVLSLNHG